GRVATRSPAVTRPWRGVLALGLAGSALSDSRVVAALTCFAGRLGLFFVGELAEVVRDLGPLASAAVHHLDLRGHMDDMARGAIDLDAIALWLGLVAVGLAGAVVLCARGRGSRAAARRRLGAFALVALCAVLANVLAARHPARWDVTAGEVNQLDERTRAVLESVDRPV